MLAVAAGLFAPAIHQTLLRDINPGPAPLPTDTGSSRMLRAAGNGVFFARATRNEAFELWRSDGTAAGTALVVDLCPGECSGITDGEVLGNRIFFAGFDTATFGTRELHVSDGTTSGTHLLADINPGGAASYPSHFRLLNGNLVFTAFAPGPGRELWISDGTGAGTRLLADLAPGTDSSSPWHLA